MPTFIQQKQQEAIEYFEKGYPDKISVEERIYRETHVKLVVASTIHATLERVREEIEKAKTEGYTSPYSDERYRNDALSEAQKMVTNLEE